ncbi:MAG: Rossmann-like domain-containing protein [Candidatus Helarchaeota archaeon]
MTILSDLINKILEYWNNYHLDLKIDKIGIGSHFATTILNNGSVGLCHTLYNIIKTKKRLNKLDTKAILRELLNSFRADHVHELDPCKFILYARSEDINLKALGISCINAISNYIIFNLNYDVKFDKMDEIAGLTLNNKLKVGVIGAIKPIIRQFEKIGIKTIYLKEDDLFKKQIDSENIKLVEDLNFINQVDYLFITGSSLVNESIDEILENSQNCTEVILIGPTAGCIPDPLFDKGLTRIAGMNIIDTERTYEIIINNGGTQAFKKYGRKYYIINKNKNV